MDPRRPSVITNIIDDALKLFDSYSETDERGALLTFANFPKGRSKPIIDAFKTKMKSQGAHGITMHSIMVGLEETYPEIGTLSRWLNALEEEAKKIPQLLAHAQSHGMSFTGPGDSNDATHGKRQADLDPNANSKKNKKTHEDDKSRKPLEDKTAKHLCKGCGKPHHGECRFANHPLYNTSSKAWIESDIGIKVRAKNQDIASFPIKQKLDGDMLVSYEWKVNNNSINNLFSTVTSNNTDNNSFRRGTLLLKGKVQRSRVVNPTDIFLKKSELCEVLIDSGAYPSNYIRKSFVDNLIKNSYDVLVRNIKKQKVKAAFGNETFTSQIVILNMTVYTETQHYCLNGEEYKVVDELPHDIIVGLDSIRGHDLTKHLRDHFVHRGAETTALRDPMTYILGSDPNSVKNSTVDETRIFTMGAIATKDELLDLEPNDDEIEFYTKDSSFLDNNQHNSEQIKFNTFGDEDLQCRLRNLLHKYSDTFSRTVGQTPANIKPFELKVDKTKWETSANRAPPRPQTLAKTTASQEYIKRHLELGVIAPSQSPYWSQIHLEPKKTEPVEYRVCCDFRNINKCSESMNYPLPNIPAMLQRIGSHKPKYFAVLDLTSGYHQVPVSVDSQDFTSFRTLDGLYKWRRLPMGLKGAPSYFQQQMCNTVLVDLIHSILENYLDDFIIFGVTKEEFLQRVEMTLERMKKFNIVLNPAKCKFGMSEVEYVGHKIDESGLHFSEEKLNDLRNYSQPTTQRQLKSFLGLASYFRDHIEHFSENVHDLQAMVVPYNPSKKLSWTENTTQLL